MMINDERTRDLVRPLVKVLAAMFNTRLDMKLETRAIDLIAGFMRAYAADADLEIRTMIRRDGWMCEAHPGNPWPDCPIEPNCAGPGMPWVLQGRATLEPLRRLIDDAICEAGMVPDGSFVAVFSKEARRVRDLLEGGRLDPPPVQLPEGE